MGGSDNRKYSRLRTASGLNFTTYAAGNALCAPGYTAPMCSECDNNPNERYYRTFSKECARCETDGEYILLTLLMIWGTIFGIGTLIFKKKQNIAKYYRDVRIGMPRGNH